MKRSEVLISATAQMTLGKVMLSKSPDTKGYISYGCIYEMPQQADPQRADLWVPGGWLGGQENAVTASWAQGFRLEQREVLDQAVVMAAQRQECP